MIWEATSTAHRPKRWDYDCGMQKRRD